MEEVIRRLKARIAESGYLSATRIAVELPDLRTLAKEEANLDDVLAALEADKAIHKVEYTNRFVAPYRMKDLYIYNPNKRKRKPRNKQNKKDKKE